MEDQLSTTGGGIDLLGQALKADIPAVKLGDSIYEILEGAAKPVKAPKRKRTPPTRQRKPARKQRSEG